MFQFGGLGPFPWRRDCSNINAWMQALQSSVEHDPVSGSRSNRILQFRTGSGLAWILKKSTWSDMVIQTALITAV